MSTTFRDLRKIIVGYFGGYISKAQPTGVYELKKSIATLPYLKKKLLERKSKPSHQLAHTVNRMFTTLESRGIDYNEKDNLSAEFIRTCRHADFYGKAFLLFASQVMDGKTITEKMILPQYRFGKAFRAMADALRMSSQASILLVFEPIRVRPILGSASGTQTRKRLSCIFVDMGATSQR